MCLRHYVFTADVQNPYDQWWGRWLDVWSVTQGVERLLPLGVHGHMYVYVLSDWHYSCAIIPQGTVIQSKSLFNKLSE